nr:hypothetical protein [Tanacetum cinerariifolium]
TIVASSTTKAEYVVAASGCGQVLRIQNQLLDYGHHFIRDCFEMKLISVDHIHTDDNVANLLTKPFDAGRFQYLVVEQAMKGFVKGNHIIYTTFTIVATLTTEAEYVAAASGCGQVLWIQNQLLDYGHHFIRDCFEKKLISVDHIHTDDNVADLLTKPFNAGRFQYLVVSIGMLNPPNKYFYPLYNPYNTVIMARLAFYDYHNMIAILEKYEHNTDFHQIVDFVEASHLRIKTTDEGTKILVTVYGKPRTISESSIRRNLKLRDEAVISSLPDAELFKNLTLMGYNILPNQKFSFQKGQFSHQWKYLIHTIMQYSSPKSTGFNEFSSNISIALVCLATNSVYNFSKMIFDGMVRNVNNKVSKFLMYPRQYTRRARIAQSLALPPVADEPASPIEGDSQGLSIWRTEMEEMMTHLEICHNQRDEVGDRGGSRYREEYGKRKQRHRGNEVAIVSIPFAGEIPTVSVPTGSGVVPTASLIFTTATVATPYSRRKGKEKMFESETPKKKKLQEQMDVQMARQLKKEMAKDAQRMNEQIAKDAEIARINAEEELQIMIDGLDRNNETVAKYLQDYHQFAADLSIGERIELINDLVKFQDNYAKVLKPSTSRGCSKEEGERFKRKGISLEQDSAKKVKISEEDLKAMMQLVPVEEDSAKKVKISEEDLKAMMQLVPVEEVYVEALQVKHSIIDWEIQTEGQRSYWKIIRLGGSTSSYQFFVDMLKHFDREDLNQLWALVKETLNIRQATSNKEKELWVELKRLYEPDVEDQLWSQTQALMYDTVE